MSKPKKGQLLNTVPPAPPDEVHLADHADPGTAGKAKAQEQARGKGKYGETKASAHKNLPRIISEEKEAELEAAKAEQKVENTWVGIELVDELGNPVCGLKFCIELPNGKVKIGTTDAEGKGKVEDIEPGQCSLMLPDIDKDAW